MISQETIQELMLIDAAKGVAFWKRRDRKWFTSYRLYKSWNAIYPGKQVGCETRYVRVSVLGKRYLLHRLIYISVHGSVCGEVDHINHDRSDNRIVNLRLVTRTVNSRNASQSKLNTSGVTGVHWHTINKKWRAKIHVDGIDIHLGMYKNKGDAIRARKSAEKKYGFHPNHGVIIQSY